MSLANIAPPALPSRLSHALTSDASLAHIVADSIEENGFASFIVIQEASPPRDALAAVSTTNDPRYLPTPSALDWRNLLVASAVLQIVLCIVFLIVGVYGFDKSNYKPCPPCGFFAVPTCRTAARPFCPYGPSERGQYNHLFEQPKAPSFAKFFYANGLGQSVMLLAALAVIGRSPGITKSLGIINFLTNFVISIVAVSYAWAEMEFRENALYYQIPLTILAITSFGLPILTIVAASAMPWVPPTPNTLIVRDASDSEILVVDDVREGTTASTSARSRRVPPSRHSLISN